MHIVALFNVLNVSGTRFRPLSLDIPKPLFPLAGVPLIQHHIEACASLKDIKEILLIGFYPVAQIESFINEVQSQYPVAIKYLQEFTALGTGGGLYHFRDQIRSGQPDAFFVMNGDVSADFPLEELYGFHKNNAGALVRKYFLCACKICLFLISRMYRNVYDHKSL